MHFERSRAELGPGFIRILSYFREDGAKSVAQIEAAMREQNTAALVIPAHTLKGEARQFGAEPLAKVAELIESTARFCIETRRFPDELVTDVVELRRLFEQTLELFDKATNPLLSRVAAAAGFGRKARQPGFRTDLGTGAPSRASASAAAGRAPGCATAIRADRRCSGRATASTRRSITSQIERRPAATPRRARAGRKGRGPSRRRWQVTTMAGAEVVGEGRAADRGDALRSASRPGASAG